MAKRIAQFHKVSYEQFKEGVRACFPEHEEGDIQDIYNDIAP